MAEYLDPPSIHTRELGPAFVREYETCLASPGLDRIPAPRDGVSAQRQNNAVDP